MARWVPAVACLVGAGSGAVAAAAAGKKLPDLRVKAISLSVASVHPGGSVNVKDVTVNRGRSLTRPSKTTYYLSKHGTKDRADTALASRRAGRPTSWSRSPGATSASP